MRSKEGNQTTHKTRIGLEQQRSRKTVEGAFKVLNKNDSDPTRTHAHSVERIRLEQEANGLQEDRPQEEWTRE